jgi:hypothetical protein
MTTQSVSGNISAENPRVCTTRLDVAAFLLVRGYEIFDVKLSGPTATFAFKDPELGGDTAVKQFYNGAQVSANEYADAQKRIRDLMWEAKRRQP